jgi:alpha-L-fucosidase
MNAAGIPKAEYQGFAKQFNPVKYDPDAWVRLAKNARIKPGYHPRRTTK